MVVWNSHVAENYCYILGSCSATMLVPLSVIFEIVYASL